MLLKNFYLFIFLIIIIQLKNFIISNIILKININNINDLSNIIIKNDYE